MQKRSKETSYKGNPSMDMQTEYIDDGTNFHKIDPMFINPENLVNFSIFEKMRHQDGLFRFRCLLVDPESITKERLMKLLASWQDVFIHERQKHHYNAYLKENLAYILDHKEIEMSKKTSTLTNLSMDVVKKAFETNFGVIKEAGKALSRIEALISQAITFVSDINSLNGLAKLIGHDYDTHAHSIKVGWLMAVFINGNQDLFDIQSKEELRQLLVQTAVSGLLHDIGKVKIPNNVLNKKGKLDNMEYILVQSHTAYSMSLLFNSGISNLSMQAILYHHENEDGSGYPCGLSQEDIPLIAKICHIADVFDALTSKRDYKEAKPPFEALKIMTGQNPFLDTLLQFEKEARENTRTPVTTHVRDSYDARLRLLREREMLEAEAQKRVEARMKIRDRGMAHCFNPDLLKRFIYTLNRSESFQLSGLL